MVGARAELTPLKLVLALDRDVGYHHGEHLLVNINSCYPVRHRFLLVGSGERAASYFMQGHGLSPLPSGEDDAQLFAQSSTLRIRQSDGLDFSIVASTSPLPTFPNSAATLTHFHEISRAVGPTKTDRPSRER